MLPACYLEPIMLVFHCLRLDNWCAVHYAINLSWLPQSIRNNFICGFWEVYHVGDMIKRFFWGIVKCFEKFGCERVKNTSGLIYHI